MPCIVADHYAVEQLKRLLYSTRKCGILCFPVDAMATSCAPFWSFLLQERTQSRYFDHTYRALEVLEDLEVLEAQHHRTSNNLVSLQLV